MSDKSHTTWGDRKLTASHSSFRALYFALYLSARWKAPCITMKGGNDTIEFTKIENLPWIRPLSLADYPVLLSISYAPPSVRQAELSIVEVPRLDMNLCKSTIESMIVETYNIRMTTHDCVLYLSFREVWYLYFVPSVLTGILFGCPYTERLRVPSLVW